MDVGSPFGADAESPEAFEPGEDAFDWPADCAETGAVFDAAFGVDPPWPATRLADHATDRWDGIDERDQLGDVVAMPAGERDDQRDLVHVGDQVMLGTGLAPIDRARPGVVPL